MCSSSFFLLTDIDVIAGVRFEGLAEGSIRGEKVSSSNPFGNGTGFVRLETWSSDDLLNFIVSADSALP